MLSTSGVQISFPASVLFLVFTGHISTVHFCGCSGSTNARGCARMHPAPSSLSRAPCWKEDLFRLRLRPADDLLFCSFQGTSAEASGWASGAFSWGLIFCSFLTRRKPSDFDNFRRPFSNDTGILASRDPVAIDHASFDLVNTGEGLQKIATRPASPCR